MRRFLIFLCFIACSKAKQPVYLDFLATTPCDHQVVCEMQSFFSHNFGNPSSHHAHGDIAKQELDSARQKVEKLVNATDFKVIFTSGTTESNNTILKGLAQSFKKQGKNHIITSQIEHKSILEPCKHLEKQGFNVTYIPVDKNGIVDVKAIQKAITPQTFLISIMAVNNELGAIQPIESIGEICKKSNIIFHVDGAQAVGKIPVDMKKAHIDALSISSHKMYGPKGVGALCVAPHVFEKLLENPLIQGGGQEFGLRSGTTPVVLCVGFGKACDIAGQNMAAEYKKIAQLRQYFFEKLKSHIPDVEINGSFEQSIPGCLSIRIPKAEHRVCKREGLQKHVSVSTGSACSSGKKSYVLEAIGVPEDDFYILRISLGRFTTKKDIDYSAKAISSNFE